MTVHCPHCTTGYLLPDHLLGPRGARVRCPACRRPFVVLRNEAHPSEPLPQVASPLAAGIAEATTLTTVESTDVSGSETEPGLESTPDLEPAADLQPTPAEITGAAEAPPADPSESIAAEILEALAARLGPRLMDARERGRVLAELGPELMKAYDDYRTRAGAGAPREAFGSVLRERWGVDLFGGR